MVPVTKRQREAEKQRILDEMAYPWDRQPGEPEKTFSLFLRYLNLGRTRNYVKVAKTCEICYQTICEYANKYSWKVRADKHDVAEEEEFKIKLDTEIMQSRVRQQRIGQDMQELASCGITMLNEYPEELSAQDISKLIDIGVKIERLALNSSTEITETKIDAKVEVKTEYISPELAAKIGKELAIEQSEKVDDGE